MRWVSEVLGTLKKEKNWDAIVLDAVALLINEVGSKGCNCPWHYFIVDL